MEPNSPLELREIDFAGVFKAADGESRETKNAQLADAKAVISEETHEQNRKGLENKDLAQNIFLRKLFGGLTFGLVAVWMAATMMLIYLIAFSVAELTDTVLIALITTTLATVVGLLWLVLAYLFPREGK